MQPADIRVTIDQDCRAEMPDGSFWHGVEVRIAMPSEYAGSGWVYTSLMAESTECISEKSIDALARLFAQNEDFPGSPAFERFRAECFDAINAALSTSKAFVHAP